MRETNKAKSGFEDYYAMGPGRSLRKLAERYQSDTEESPPTTSLRWLKAWSSGHNWQDRVAERDAEIANAQFEAIKAASAEAGYAFWPKRVKDMDELAKLLFEEILTEDKRWLPDVKQIGGGEFAERVDLVRFNASLIQQWLKTLEDIAAEYGHRKRAIEVSAPDGTPLFPISELIAALREAEREVEVGEADKAESDDEG